MKTKFLLLASALLLVGCSGVRQIGTVGNVNYYKVNIRGFAGPNITALVTETDGAVKTETAAAGTGLGHTIIGSAGNVGAAAAFGLSIRPDRETVNNGSNSNSGSSSGSLSASTSNSSATGGNSNAAGGAGGVGNGGAGGAGGKGGHPASPGNGGIPGNGGQNGNGK
jgi:hypothetical protein